jgi:predicted short-subunit dehydrogenase-like oxidoreductase (DUF2520 family)
LWLDQPIAIVGAGAVAQALGQLLLRRGAKVVALASRTRHTAERAAKFIGPTVQVVTITELPLLARRLLVATSDNAIEPVARMLAEAGMSTGVALHMCGAKGPEALGPLRLRGVACGVLHPLQTIVTPEQGARDLLGVTFGVAGDHDAVEWAEEIVKGLDGKPLRIKADRLGSYHAAAVMSSNALVAVIDAAVVLMMRAGIEEQAALKALAPIARASLENILRLGPRTALTGPIARGDVSTVTAHMDALATAPPAIAALYRAVAEQLLVISRQRDLPAPTLRALQAAIQSRKVDSANDEPGPDN